MAIDADVILYHGRDAMRLPPVQVMRVSAAGAVDFTQDAEKVAFRNLSTSQTVYIRLNLDADNTAAANGDALSPRVQPGETFTFDVPDGSDLTNYKLMVA